MVRHIVSIHLIALGFFFSACGDGGSGGGAGSNGGNSNGNGSTAEGGGVGSACSADDQCTGYDHPVCIDELRPLEDIVEDTGDEANTALRELTIPFPGGYCTNPLESSCETDAACGDAGGCYRPFEGVSDENIENLNNLGLPFDVTRFAEVGLCLEPCTDDSECRTDEGYECTRPIAAFMDVINPDYEKNFCVVDVDVSHLLQ